MTEPNTQFAEVENSPIASVESVKISGNHKTKQSYFDNELRTALACKDLRCLHHELDIAARNLKSTGVFYSADVVLNLLRRTEKGLDVSIGLAVREVKNPEIKAGANTMAGSGNGNSPLSDMGVEIETIVPNLLGLAETYRATYRTNDSNEKVMSMSASFPSVSFPGDNHSLPVNILARRFHEDRTLTNSVHTKCDSFSISTSSKNLMHRFTAEAVIRDDIVSNGSLLSADSNAKEVLSIPGHVKDASPNTMAAIGTSMKTSLMYTYTNDSRNSASNSTSGSLLELQLEVQ